VPTTTTDRFVIDQGLADEVAADDEAIVRSVVMGTTPSHSLEVKLGGDHKRAALLRRKAVEQATDRSLRGLPVEGFDYEAIYGRCCELPVGFVQLPVGVVGPLLLDGKEYLVPMATTEGCLVASTNRGCKAVTISGGASSVILRDGITRAPIVRFGSAKRAAEVKSFVEDARNFDDLAMVFNRLAFQLNSAIVDMHVCTVQENFLWFWQCLKMGKLYTDNLA